MFENKETAEYAFFKLSSPQKTEQPECVNLHSFNSKRRHTGSSDEELDNLIVSLKNLTPKRMELIKKIANNGNDSLKLKQIPKNTKVTITNEQLVKALKKFKNNNSLVAESFGVSEFKIRWLRNKLPKIL